MLSVAVACSDGGLTKHNAGPKAEITSPAEHEAVPEGMAVVLRGSASDPDDAPLDLEARWFVDDEPACVGTPDTAGGTECSILVPRTEFQIELEVRDPDGAVGQTSRILSIDPNAPPSVTIEGPTEGSEWPSDAPVRLLARISDEEDSPEELSLAWSSTLDGALSVESTLDSDGLAEAYVSLPLGAQALQVVVTDSAGATDTASVLITVVEPNEAPTCGVLAPSDGAVLREGAAVELIGEGADGEDSAGTLVGTWESSLDGVIDAASLDSGGRSVVVAPALSRGDHLLAFTVTDSRGAVCTDSVALQVNGAPDAPIVSISPASPRTGDDLTLNLDVVSTDPEGETLAYTIEWLVDGTLSLASDTGVLPATATARGERWQVSVRANDGVGPGAAGVAEVLVGNTAPSAAALAITPDPATAADTLRCTLSGFADADGDADLSTYAWTVGSTAAGVGDTLAGAFQTGDTVTCTATPFDGTDAGAPLSASLTISNSPPSIVAISLSPSAPVTTDTLVASVTATDPEGDAISLSYDWLVNGISVGVTGTSLGASYSQKGDVVALDVTPRDAHGVGATQRSASLTIQNSPPTAPAVALTPPDPDEGEDVLCSVTSPSSDADGDTVSYRMGWTADGAAYPRSGDVGPSTVTWPDDEATGADTAARELWTCTVTPNDGADDGAPASVSVTIDDGVDRVFVTASDFSGDTSGLTGADLICQDAADTAGLGGAWVAYMSDTGTNAIDRVGLGPFVLLDGTVIATSRADLTDGSISHAINLDENGATQSKWVKTGTDTNGTRGTSSSTNGLCTNWTNGCGVCYGNHFYATTGRSYETGSGWTNVGWLFCSQSSGIYCFEL